MQKLYGSSLRREAGLTKVIKKVAMKNALLLESRAQRHAPELKRVAKEVIGTFDKVYEETAEAVKELFPSPVHAAGAGLVGRVGGLTARFDLDDVVEGTKELLQQGREKLVFRSVFSSLFLRRESLLKQISFFFFLFAVV
jgi:phosphatidylethanolamine N-methyltransferase